MKDYIIGYGFFFVLWMILIVFTGGNAQAGSNPFRSPWEKNGKKKISEAILKDSNDRGFLAESFLQAVTFFQIFISPADGDRCPMYPSCSRYATQAVRKYGIFKGIMLTSDRLLRCGRETDYPLIYRRGRYYYFDPLCKNIL